MGLPVPKSAHTGLRLLAELDEKDVEQLAATLKEAPPAGASDRLANDVASRIAWMPPSKVRTIVRSLVALHIGRAFYELGIEDFSREITEELREEEEFEPVLDRLDAVFQDRVERFLNLKSPLGITAKATRLLTEHEHLLFDTKVLTDVRSVFSEDATEVPVGAVIIHMLGIHYHDGGEHKEIFFALDASRLQQLSDTLERARKKADTLQAVLERAQVPYLQGDDQEGR